MKFYIATLALLASTSAYAQNGVTALPKINSEIWNIVPTDTGATMIHKKSGATCANKFQDLTLTAIKDFRPEGNDSACEYEKRTQAGLTRMTAYIYSYPGLTGPAAYKGAKSAIFQNAKTTALQVTEQRGEGQKCFQVYVPKLAATILEKNKKDNPGQKEDTVQLGVAAFDFETPRNSKRAARSETSLLSVYQTGKWVVKTRVTMPKSETSYIDSCRYVAIHGINEAQVISRK